MSLWCPAHRLQTVLHNRSTVRLACRTPGPIFGRKWTPPFQSTWSSVQLDPPRILNERYAPQIPRETCR
jgi:hypothetical protein